MKKSYFAFAALAFVSALVSTMGCSAQVTVEERLGTAGAAGGNTTSTPTPTETTITTGTVPPSHTPGQVIVTDENVTTLDPNGEAALGSDGVIVMAFSIEAVGNDADVHGNVISFTPTDGGSVLSLAGDPYFSGWALVEMSQNPAAPPDQQFTVLNTVDNDGQMSVEGAALKVRFEKEMSVSVGAKHLYGVVMNVGHLPSQADKPQLINHEYQAEKEPYVQGDILDGNGLVTPASEVHEDVPILGVALLITP